MNDSQRKRNFWLGNAILAIALVVLLNLESLSKAMGFGAMILWIVLVAVGATLVMSDKGGSNSSS